MPWWVALLVIMWPMHWCSAGTRTGFKLPCAGPGWVCMLGAPLVFVKFGVDSKRAVMEKMRRALKKCIGPLKHTHKKKRMSLVKMWTDSVKRWLEMSTLLANGWFWCVLSLNGVVKRNLFTENCGQNLFVKNLFSNKTSFGSYVFPTLGRIVV